jgi:hypothetical protein
MTGQGMYSGLSPFEMNLWEAEAKLDHWRYFGQRHPDFFVERALFFCKICLDLLNDVVATRATEPRIPPERVADLWRIVNECLSYTEGASPDPDEVGAS